ncbi:hypothetical protein C1H76_1359 [Elsinoe australis]|uniref:Uncharacterized protein n=1 Tax=Elsinoe australis TaxID=40998 RepID=A0A4U7BED7_9PEZI|nr:hypothetical protein C1H76_1359 [Elsinoe australis]
MSRDATRQYSLKSRGSMFDMLHGRACAMAERGDQDGCNDICRLLLEHNDLDNDYKARCHLFLGQGQDDYLWHAQQAVSLYENLIMNPRGTMGTKATPSNAVRDQIALLIQARTNLHHAEEDYEVVRANYERQAQDFRNYYQRNPTEDELRNAQLERHDRESDAYRIARDPPRQLTVRNPSDEMLVDDDYRFPSSPPPSSPSNYRKGVKQFSTGQVRPDTPMPSSPPEVVMTTVHDQ